VTRHQADPVSPKSAFFEERLCGQIARLIKFDCATAINLLKNGDCGIAFAQFLQSNERNNEDRHEDALHRGSAGDDFMTNEKCQADENEYLGHFLLFVCAFTG
jgi:hypothetical protein